MGSTYKLAAELLQPLILLVWSVGGPLSSWFLVLWPGSNAVLHEPNLKQMSKTLCSPSWSLISIRFGSCEVRRLTRTLIYFTELFLFACLSICLLPIFLHSFIYISLERFFLVEELIDLSFQLIAILFNQWLLWVRISSLHLS